MIPGMVNVLEQCLKENDEESASEIFEVFDTLLMLVITLMKRIFSFVSNCVSIIGCTSFI